MAKKKTTKKKSAKKKKTVKKPAKPKVYCEFDEDIIEQMVNVAVIQGAADSQLRAVIPGTFSAAKKTQMVEEVRFRIRAAAHWDRSIEIGESITKLKRLQEAAFKVGKLAEYVAAQRELSKLMDLYTQPVGGRGDESPDDEQRIDELEKVEQHLRPLGLAGDDYPVSGLARIAAERIMQSRAQA